MTPSPQTPQAPRHAVALDPTPTLPVAGSDEVFPVGRIFCIGRNYAEHALEMGHDPDREPPFFFAKPANALVQDGSELDFPVATEDLHHEIELVVALGRGGRDVPEDRALDLVFGYAVGLDMTRRDLQADAKRAGRPWDMAKGFDESAPTSAVRTVDDVGHPAQGEIRLEIDGETRQVGDLAEQIWAVPEALAYLSTLVELRPGDLLMTGTPAGVGPVRRGERLVGSIAGLGELTVTYRS
ncbi:fumarylacetoacetate hydrolase family protein [Nocardioides iriomotensis]|uniref:FAA hydrolase family protein n=1 Tax=Nocardioides iriomotensis TaxID=715784 RepID=A0A4Q5IYA2_9ACTN|nr:fumarylacetoacetate hydrolase family protein [Nocardioides iriomotensis]RYU10983.1 FAA hydrolase family protein [Nocardioides iriomotensis]